jgi:hypothetical protein
MMIRKPRRKSLDISVGMADTKAMSNPAPTDRNRIMRKPSAAIISAVAAIGLKQS